MININFYKFGDITDDKLLFAVIMARYNGRWIYVKHKERETWEIPGGHREVNEDINNTASRELFEETGAINFKLIPVCVYSVESGNEEGYTESFGGLYYAEVKELDTIPNFEIGEIKLVEDIPENLTYPHIQPFLHNKIVEGLIK